MCGVRPKKNSASARYCPPWTGFVVCLTWIVWFGTPCAAQDPENKVARLGFKFDQRTHDAAVAAAKAASERDDRGPEVLADGVIRLPKYYVNEERMPFNSRDILTPEGQLALAKKRYISPVYAKTLGPLSAVASLIMNPLGGWQPNGPEAMTLYKDEEQKQRNADMKALTKLDAAGR